MHLRVSKSLVRVFALACMALLPAVTHAQAAPSASGGFASPAAPKWDVFLGYSYLSPNGTVNTPIPGGTVLPGSYDNVVNGQIVSGSYFLNHYLGIQAEAGIHEWGVTNPSTFYGNGTTGNNDGFLTFSGGLIARYPRGKFTPFVHVLGGEAMVDGPVHNPFTWGPSITGGAGLDYLTPWFHHRLSLRLFQVDYEYMHADFGTGTWGGVASINALRGSAGIVLHHGNFVPREGLSLACSASPADVYAGDPVTLSAMAGGLEPKANAIYSWSGAGVSGTGESISVNTATMAPGVQTVDCAVREGRPGSEGARAWQNAKSTATFTVKVFDAPTVSCSASPATITPGESSTITAMGVSPQNRPLTYSYSAPVGSVTGTGASAVYSSTGAPTGTVTINCTVSDDKSQTASASTSVTITAPYVAPAPRTQALCSISFSKDTQRPTRVDNEAKACLDEVALDLARQPDAKAVVVGNVTTAEKLMHANAKNGLAQNMAALRAVNTKAYLVGEKGIDPSRIAVATGSAEASSVEDYLVPAGANPNADLTGITPVDEAAVKPQARLPLTAAHTARKHAAKPVK